MKTLKFAALGLALLALTACEKLTKTVATLTAGVASAGVVRNTLTGCTKLLNGRKKDDERF